MTETTRPELAHFVPAEVTQLPLEWAELAVIDLSKAKTPEGRAEVAIKARDAMKTVGFFYVINHGYTQPETTRMFDIANVPFAHVPEDEKLQYVAKMKEDGSWQGYKPRSYWHIDNGVLDSNETFNINRDVTKKVQPTALRPYLPEIRDFARFNHYEILHEILRLLAIGLELPEEHFVNMHDYNAVGESYIRFMKYYPRPEDHEAKTKGVWMKGHTDFGSVTLLWSQPVSALQVLGTDGKWRWVRHVENGLVVNAGDMMEFMSGGFYKATIHRVMQPPQDQWNHERLGIIYFALPDDSARLAPVDSPLLKRVGITKRFEEGKEPLVETWRKARVSAYGTSALKASQQGEITVEEEVISGTVVKHYT